MARRAARPRVHAALADPARLRIVDALAVGDASPSELAAMLGMPSTCSPTTCTCSWRPG